MNPIQVHSRGAICEGLSLAIALEIRRGPPGGIYKSMSTTSYFFLKSISLVPHLGQTQELGNASKGVLAGISPSPSLGS